MSVAFVLGNGVSRKNINNNSLKELGKIYGCNGLYREFVPYALIATDKPIATRIQESGYSANHRFHTRKPIDGLGAKPVPQDYYGYSSGPIAAALAAMDGHRRIYLLGFDMGPVANNGFNNIYADTEFYKSSGSPPTYTGNWVRQLVKIVKDHPHTRFFRICGETTARMPELESLENLMHCDLSTFIDRINNKKDL
jgi:hypothetical protein